MKNLILAFIIAFIFQFNTETKAQTFQLMDAVEISTGGSSTVNYTFASQGDVFYWTVQTAASGESVSTFVNKTINEINYVAYKSDSTASSALISALPGYFDKRLQFVVTNLGSSEATVSLDIAVKKL